MEMSKKVSNFVEEKRETPNIFNSDASPPCRKNDCVTVFPLALEEKGTVPPYQNGIQPSNNAMHMQTSEMCAIDEVYQPNNFFLLISLPNFTLYSLRFHREMILNVRHRF
jgi:hypothetical protein